MMKIGLVGSLEFIDKFSEFSEALSKQGHTPFTSQYLDRFLNKSIKDIQKEKQAFDEDYIKDFWETMQGADALLVLNYEKRGIPGYIGGSTLIEMSFAHVLGMKIYLINPPPQIQYYYDEILSMKPIVINGDLDLIRN